MDPLTIGAITVGASLLGGFGSRRAAKKQRAAIDAQVRIAVAEKQREIEKFSGDQAMAYLATGVTLEGSPLMVLKETREQGARDIEAIKATGGAQGRAVMAQGRSGFFQGLTSAAVQGLGIYNSMGPAKSISTPTPSYTGGWTGDTSRFGGYA